MICSKCTAFVNDSAKFCENCGEQIRSFEYPITDLHSSGPMKYRKTDLSFARIDLSSKCIDLNEKYSKYVIPPIELKTTTASSSAEENSYFQDNAAQKNTQRVYAPIKQTAVASAPQKITGTQNNQIKANKPFDASNAQNIPQNINNGAEPGNFAQNRNFSAGSGYFPNSQNNQRFPNMGNAPVSYNKPGLQPNKTNSKSDVDKSTVIGFIAAIISMMFMTEPFVAFIVAVFALINIARSKNKSGLKNAAICISCFVLICSFSLCISFFT